MGMHTIGRCHRLIKALVLLLAAIALTAASEGAEAFVPLRLGEVKPEGWLKATLTRDLVSGYAGHLDELLQDPVSKKYLLKPENDDFVTRENNRDCRRDAGGLCIPPGRHEWWHAEMIGDWHDSLIRAAYLTGEPAARAKADRFVEAILGSQDEDGYIGIYPKGYRFHFSGPDAELWTQRCVMLPLLAYYEFTGRKDVLEAVERAVKLTISQYGPDGPNYFDNPGQIGSGVAHGLMFVDVLEWLHRTTGDDAYGRAALLFYNQYNSANRVKNPDAKLARLLDPQVPFSGHGPDVMGFLRIPLWCYYLTGDDVYWRAWQNSMRKTANHLGVGGSPLSGQAEEITREGQTPDMPYEYCSTFYLIHSLIWAMQKTGESRYGDMLERALFNAAQGARFANGKALTYYSADERFWVRQRPPEGHPNARYIYTAAFYPSCCHDSGARVYPYAISSLWMRSRGSEGDGLVATLYGPSIVRTDVQGVAVAIREETDYPFAFQIKLVVDTQQPVRFPLRLRVPAWSLRPELTAPGVDITSDSRGFLVVTKTWRRGDVVLLQLKPSIRGVTAVDGTTAVAYGPLVFSLPIPERQEIVQRFSISGASEADGFCAYQFDPADVAWAKRPLKLVSDQPPFAFRLVEQPDRDSRYPWDRPALSLQGPLVGADGERETVVLLPMGSTILRRTCFPRVQQSHEPQAAGERR